MAGDSRQVARASSGLSEVRTECKARAAAEDAAAGERPRAEHSRAASEENDEGDDQRVDDEGARHVHGRAAQVQPLLQGDRQEPRASMSQQHQGGGEHHQGTI
jgi:hypothetical protein